MTKDDDETVVRLRAKLNLAFRLMTQYQKDRHKKLWLKFKTRQTIQERTVFQKSGRPRVFKGTIPSASTLLATRMAEDERLHNDR